MFPELNAAQNATIKAAREKGFASYYPAYPTAHSQARSTYRAAVRYLAREFAEALTHADTHCWECDNPRDYTTQPACPHCGADVTPF